MGYTGEMEPSDSIPLPSLDGHYQAVWAFADPAGARRVLSRVRPSEEAEGVYEMALWKQGRWHGLSMGWWEPAQPELFQALQQSLGAVAARSEEIWLAHVSGLNQVRLQQRSSRGVSEWEIALQAPPEGWASPQSLLLDHQMLLALHSQVWELYAQGSVVLEPAPAFAQAVLDNDRGLARALAEVKHWDAAHVAAWWEVVEQCCIHGKTGSGQYEPFPLAAGSRAEAFEQLLVALPAEHRDIPRLCRVVPLLRTRPWFLESLLPYASADDVWDFSGVTLGLVLPRGKSLIPDVEELFFKLSPAKQREALMLGWDAAQEHFEGQEEWPAGGVGRVDFGFVARAFAAQPHWSKWGDLLAGIGAKMVLPVMAQELSSTLRARELDLRLPAPPRSRGPRF